VTSEGGALQPGYTTSGIDVRFVVVTGFPGVALGTSAYDRLRGAGAAAAAMAQFPVEVRFAGRGNAEPGGRDLLGSKGRAALALVSHEVFFGPCSELARSRRLRRVPTFVSIANDDPLSCETSCRINARDPAYVACRSAPGETICEDGDPNARAAAVLELQGPLEVTVLDENNTFLRSLNEDLRPRITTANPPAVVEGVLGMAGLAQLVSTIDYPGRRFITRCVAGAPDCLAYPRYLKSNECDRNCTEIGATYAPESSLDLRCDVTSMPRMSARPGGLCPPAPPR
jgi:hypothetical protein